MAGSNPARRLVSDGSLLSESRLAPNAQPISRPLCDLKTGRVSIHAASAALIIAWFSVASAQAPEGSMGQYPLPYVATMVGSDAYTVTLTFERQQTYDPRGIQFYGLTLPDGGRAALSLDADLPLAQVLAGWDKQKVRMVLDPMLPERLER
jgi:hypothetical protein